MNELRIFSERDCIACLCKQVKIHKGVEVSEKSMNLLI